MISTEFMRFVTIRGGETWSESRNRRGVQTTSPVAAETATEAARAPEAGLTPADLPAAAGTATEPQPASTGTASRGATRREDSTMVAASSATTPQAGHSSPGATAYTAVPIGAASIVPLVAAPV